MRISFYGAAARPRFHATKTLSGLRTAGRKVTNFTRNCHDWTDRFPHLTAELAAHPTCIIDAAGMANFAALQRAVSKRQEDGLGPANIAVLCRRALDAGRLDQTKGLLTEKLKRAGWNDEFMLKLLSQMR